MRSNLITVVTVVASFLFVPLMASADPVQEQLRLMEQRMAEMEDRLQATSVELQTAKATVDQQQGLLTDAGLIDADNSGLRSGVGDFFKMVEVSGVVATSYNQRLTRRNTSNNGGTGLVPNPDTGSPLLGQGGNDLFRHPNSNTFAVDQVWLAVGKTPTEESRGGFYFDYVTGVTGTALGGSDTEPYLFNAYVSYLACCFGGVQIDLGLFSTPLGAESVRTDQNFFVTQGNLWGLQPVTHAGIQFSGGITDELSYIFGIVNEVYDATLSDASNDKAYFGQLSFSTQMMNLSVGAITGSDRSDDFTCRKSTTGSGSASDCSTTLIDVVMTADPTDNLSVWANFDYIIKDGADRTDGAGAFDRKGDAWGVSVAGRLAINEKTGVASRVEWTREMRGFSERSEQEAVQLLSVTGTVDRALTDHVTVRGEVRWDRFVDVSRAQGFSGGGTNRVVALLEALFSF